MPTDPVVLCLPTVDRRRACTFYQEALGLDAVGELAEDGVPEPLRLVVNAGLHLMLIPLGGFGWVLGERPAAPGGHSECILTLQRSAPSEVDELVARAVRAGAEVVTSPEEQSWGYTATFADPDGHLWMVSAGRFPR